MAVPYLFNGPEGVPWELVWPQYLDDDFAYLADGGDIIVENLAALKAMTARPRGVLVLSGQAKGVWEWEDGSSETANDATVVAPSAGPAGRWLRVYTGPKYFDWWGPAKDGVTDDIDKFDSAYDALDAGGDTLLVSPGVYAVSRKWNICDGTSTSQSTKNCLQIIGLAGVGSGEGESSLVAGVQLKYVGSNTTGGVIGINGPAFGIQIENILTNSNGGKAERGWEVTHLWKSTIRNCSAQQYRRYGWYMESIDAALPFGVTYGFMDCIFDHLDASDPRERGVQPLPNPTANGLYTNGGRTNNIGFSRNNFRNGQFMYGGDTGSHGIWIGFVDNCTFEGCFTPWQQPLVYNTGYGADFDTTCPYGFPLDNVFYNCPLQGGVNPGGTYGNQFIPYPMSDGEPQPRDPYMRGMGSVGNLFGYSSWNIAVGSIDFTYSGNSDKSFARFTPVTDGVNFPELVGAATTDPVQIKAEGDDTNIDLQLVPKGTGTTEAMRLVTPPVTVAALPSSPSDGMRAFVSDSSVVAAGNFGAVVVGGGANKVPVYYDGAWRIG